MQKRIAAAVVTIGLILAGGILAMSARYPQFTTAEAAAHVAARVLTLASHRLSLGPYTADEPAEVELANVREMILAERPDLAKADDMTMALTLRDMVYKRVPLKPTAPGFLFSDLDRTVYLSLFDDEYGHACGGLTITYMAALKAFGIKARYVGLFQVVDDAPRPVNSHASVEAFIDGRWIAMDPTFNVSIKQNGRHVGWTEAKADLTSVSFDSDGYSLLPRRTINEYPVPVSELIRFMIFGPSLNTEIVTLPQWNGVITYADGAPFDQRHSLVAGAVYAKLAQ